MNLQTFLEAKFKCWQPQPPKVVERTKCSITMDWQQEPFGFMADQLMYRVEMKNKIPPWIVVYSGGKTTKMIDNLPPRHPHRFRLRVLVKATGVPLLAEKAISLYGNEEAVLQNMEEIGLYRQQPPQKATAKAAEAGPTAPDYEEDINIKKDINSEFGGQMLQVSRAVSSKRWLESQWSEETWTSTDTDGTSIVCFCMAVRCGYLKQVQLMLEERPELIGIVNSANGFTPLATAVRKGDLTVARVLLCAGAPPEQRSAGGRTALHLAALADLPSMVQLLLDCGADFTARDVNALRIEHYAVESGSVRMVRLVLDRGGDVHVRDNNGWTPLFRALCQDAKTELIEELVMRGSDVEMCDNAGLPLVSVARLLSDRHGKERDSVLRLVDHQYPHEKALANFTRLTKKIYHIHTVFK